MPFVFSKSFSLKNLRVMLVFCILGPWSCEQQQCGVYCQVGELDGMCSEDGKCETDYNLPICGMYF